MKIFFVVLIALIIFEPADNLKAQTEHSLNVESVFSDVLFKTIPGFTHSAKVFSLNSQFYLPDTLILYTMDDSIRISASYTQEGFNINRLTQIWYNGQWANYMQTKWTYFNAGVNSLELKQYWFNGQWINATLDSSTFDANGNMLVHLYSYWYQGAWQDSILSFRTYDGNGNMLTNSGQYMTNGQWINHDRSTYTYDGDDNMLTYLFEWWSGQWTNSDQIIYTYDENGHMLTSLKQIWNGQWENATLSTYTWDANGNMLSYLLQISANGQLTNSTIHTYTYDANGKMLTDWYKGWTNGAWMNGSLSTFTYDTNENMVNKLIQCWLNGQWVNSYQTVCTYDSNGNLLTGNNSYWVNSSWVPFDNSFEININGEDYYFTGYSIDISYILINTTDLAEGLNNFVTAYSLYQNYPNPFNPSTKISWQSPAGSWQTLKVYDILGNEVATLVDEYKPAGIYEVEFQSSACNRQLASGVYFYQLIAGSYTETKKFVLLR